MANKESSGGAIRGEKLLVDFLWGRMLVSVPLKPVHFR